MRVRVYRTLKGIFSSVQLKGCKMMRDANKRSRRDESRGGLPGTLLGRDVDWQTRNSHQTRSSSEACSVCCLVRQASSGGLPLEREGKISGSLPPFYCKVRHGSWAESCQSSTGGYWRTEDRCRPVRAPDVIICVHSSRSILPYGRTELYSPRPPDLYRHRGRCRTGSHRRIRYEGRRGEIFVLTLLSSNAKGSGCPGGALSRQGRSREVEELHFKLHEGTWYCTVPGTGRARSRSTSMHKCCIEFIGGSLSALRGFLVGGPQLLLHNCFRARLFMGRVRRTGRASE